MNTCERWVRLGGSMDTMYKSGSMVKQNGDHLKYWIDTYKHGMAESIHNAYTVYKWLSCCGCIFVCVYIYICNSSSKNGTFANYEIILFKAQ